MPTREVTDRSSGAGVRTEGRRRRRIHDEGTAHAQLPPRPSTPAGYTQCISTLMPPTRLAVALSDFGDRMDMTACVRALGYKCSS